MENLTVVDISLANEQLYAGCTIETVAGRMNLTTPVDEAINLVGANVAEIVAKDENHDTVLLTGPMAVWAYLVVFHAVVHRYREVQYHDGRTPPVIVARHG